MNVDSKRTTDHQRGLELREFLEMHRDDTLRGGVEIHAHRVAKVFGVESTNACTERDAAEEALRKEKDETRGQAGPTILDTAGAKHDAPLLVRMTARSPRLCGWRFYGELEAVLGNDLFGLFVDEGKGGALGGEMDFQLCASNLLMESDVCVAVGFGFEDIKNSVL